MSFNPESVIESIYTAGGLNFLTEGLAGLVLSGGKGIGSWWRWKKKGFPLCNLLGLRNRVGSKGFISLVSVTAFDTRANTFPPPSPSPICCGVVPYHLGLNFIRFLQMTSFKVKTVVKLFGIPLKNHFFKHLTILKANFCTLRKENKLRIFQLILLTTHCLFLNIWIISHIYYVLIFRDCRTISEQSWDCYWTTPTLKFYVFCYILL
jgi:hypothetical protein